MIRILLVDDHPMLRQGVAQLIEMEDDLKVVGQVGSGEEAIDQVQVLKPDMVLLDLNMKGMSGIETLSEMRRQGVDARVIVFTVSDNRDDVIEALREGADGYLLKDSEPEDLLPAIKQAAMGQQVFSPQLSQIMADALRANVTHDSNPLETLTPRELDILKLIAYGNPNKHIARTLTISEATVKVHVKNLLKKLSLKSRLEAGIWAVKNRIK